jgi:hypothetical protein
MVVGVRASLPPFRSFLYGRAIPVLFSALCRTFVRTDANARFELLVTSSWRSVTRPYQIAAHFRPRRSSLHSYYMCSCKLIHPSSENVITSRANSTSSCRGIHFVLLSAAVVSTLDTGNVRSVHSPSGVPRGRGVWGGGGSNPPPPKFRRPSKFVPNSTRL